MKISVSSQLFQLTPPCVYHVFQEWLNSFERERTEYYKEQGLLPEGVHYVWDSASAKEVIGKAWVSTLKWHVEEIYSQAKKRNPFKFRFRKTWSPKEYNFQGDAADFEITVTKREWNRIRRRLFTGASREAFDAFLKEYHSNRSGFWSFIPDNVPGFIDRYERQEQVCRDSGPSADLETLQCIMLDFFFFDASHGELYSTIYADEWEPDREKFEQDLFERVYEEESFLKMNVEDDETGCALSDEEVRRRLKACKELEGAV